MSNDKKTIKEMRANEMTPAFPTHPGDVLKNEIEYRGISQRQLAEEMGIAYSALNEILNARRPVTEKTALLFEAALGVNAEPLLKMQMRYNLQSTKNDSTFMARLAKVRRVAAALYKEGLQFLFQSTHFSRLLIMAQVYMLRFQ